MKARLNTICERCGAAIRGAVIEEVNAPAVTCGFYNVSEEKWQEFARSPLEIYVCDRCMWTDPQFIAKYPNRQKISPE